LKSQHLHPQKSIQVEAIAHTHPTPSARGGAHAGPELRLRHPEPAHFGRSWDHGQQLHGRGYGGHGGYGEHGAATAHPAEAQCLTPIHSHLGSLDALVED